ncbi:Ldh family oxidoreductase [Pigmentiphaga soli]|uniref:Ldh family oxidoreductase n=1 Tax=Pigmentiphaga soli TaxID=1007095 RepID=A0ABP8GQK7_9BURK
MTASQHDIPRYDYAALLDYATGLAAAAGLPRDRAAVLAEVLLEADLMGHSTHGLAQLPGMLKNIEGGALNAGGEPVVVADHGASVVWDGNKLPGTWLLSRAIDEACTRAAEHPVVTYVIRRSANIASLGAYLRRATERGMVIWIMNSDPAMRTVAPAGSLDPQLAPDPLAFGYPTDGQPVLIDTSTSPIANGWIRRWAAEGRRLPEPWLQDAQGRLSDDPATLFGQPGGSMLPLGGLALGHKGFALGLIVEVLTAALSGTGRANPQEAAGGTPVFLQIINPDFFAGGGALVRETSWLAQACRASRPRSADAPVRMPGDTANALRARQLQDGVAPYPGIMPELSKWADKLHVNVPLSIS